MNKEDILARSRAENKGQDERETVIATQAFVSGGLGMAVMMLIIMLINLFTKRENAYDLFALYFSFLASGYLFEYKLLKTKQKRNKAICYTFITLIWLALYIWKG